MLSLAAFDQGLDAQPPGFRLGERPLRWSRSVDEAGDRFGRTTASPAANGYALSSDNAVLNVNAGLIIPTDLDYCKGCAICVEECPAGPME